MIVTGVQRKEVEIEVNPLTVIRGLYEEFLLEAKLPINIELRGGYWGSDERMGHDTEFVRRRLATQYELKLYTAFATINEFAKDNS